MGNEDAAQIGTDEDFVDELKPGTQLMHGQYTIESFLNAGGFGITYMARDSLDRKIVIKECFPGAFCRRSRSIVQARSRAHQKELNSMVRLFVQEAKSLAKLKHPNIVGVHQVFEDNDTAYMALDFVEGRDMLDTLDDPEARMSADQIKSMLKDILGAIGFIHDQDILHRDISPDNILIDPRGRPVLIDFGAAREEATKQSRVLSALSVVKDGYSPQEFYIAGSAQSPSSDLYALGASFYHFISGEVPPNSQARLSSIASGEKDPYVPLKGGMAGFDDNFLGAIDKALEILPKNRVQSAAEWLDMMDGKVLPTAAVAAETGPAQVAKAVSATAPATKSKSKTGLLLASAAAVAVVGFGAAFTLGGKTEAPDAAVAETPAESVVSEATQPNAQDTTVAAETEKLAAAELEAERAAEAEAAALEAERIAAAEAAALEAERIAAAEAAALEAERAAAAAEAERVAAEAQAEAERAAAIAAQQAERAAAEKAAEEARVAAEAEAARLAAEREAERIAQAAARAKAAAEEALAAAEAQAEAEAQALAEAQAEEAARELAEMKAAEAARAAAEEEARAIAEAEAARAQAAAEEAARIAAAEAAEAERKAAAAALAAATLDTPTPPIEDEDVATLASEIGAPEQPLAALSAELPVDIALGAVVADGDVDALADAALTGTSGEVALILPNTQDGFASVALPLSEAIPAFVPGNEIVAEIEVPENASVLSAWTVDLPFTASSSSSRVIASVGPVAPVWVDKGVQIDTVNGTFIPSIDRISEILRSTIDLEDEALLTVNFGITDAETGGVVEKSGRLPVVQQTALLNGLNFETRQIGDEWVTTVTQAPDTVNGDLQVGDRLIAYMRTSERIDQRTSMKTLIERELADGTSQFSFAVNRDGNMWIASLEYAENAQ